MSEEDNVSIGALEYDLNNSDEQFIIDCLDKMIEENLLNDPIHYDQAKRLITKLLSGWILTEPPTKEDS